MKSVLMHMLPGFIISAASGYWMIPKLRELKIGQYIREEGPKTHKKKAGTPTMGGFMFMLAIVLCRAISWLIERAWPTREELLILGLMLSYGFVGFLDDFRQIRFGRSLGLRAREKMALQVLFAAIFLYYSADSSSVILPFWGKAFDLGILYPVFGIVLIVGTANGMNFTDGLDGLAAGVAAAGLGAYAFIANEYAKAMNRPDLSGLTALALVSTGALLGFLVHNYNPAKVFMGDTGSLALGGLLAGYATVTRTELVLPFIALIQLIEVVSVILQVFSFQVFGKRIFKMTPIHHHFELSGWTEKNIVFLFWFVAVAGAILGIASMAYV